MHTDMHTCTYASTHKVYTHADKHAHTCTYVHTCTHTEERGEAEGLCFLHIGFSVQSKKGEVKQLVLPYPKYMCFEHLVRIMESDWGFWKLWKDMEN